MNSLVAASLALALAAPGDTLIRANLGKSMPSRDDKVGPLLHIPFLTTGPLIEEDANTVSHVYFDGTQLVDTKGNAWTENGTVAQTATHMYPGGFSSAPKSAAVFDANGESFLHAGSLATATTGFTACVVARKVVNGANEFVYSEGGGSTSGFRVMQYSGGSVELVSYTAGCTVTVSPALSSSDVYRVICFGRSGDTGYLNVNGTAASDASCTTLTTAAPAASAHIGNSLSGTSPAYSGIAEVYVTNTPYNATTVAAIIARVFGQVTSTGTPLTVTRSSAATYDVGGTLWTAPAGALRVNSDGALIEAAATNYALNSGTHPKTTEASASVTTGAAVAWHAGTGTMTLAAGTATVTGLSCTAVAAGTPCTFTVTVAGTMSITTTAGTTRVQIEKGSVPTSYIATTTTAATRQADLASLATSGSYGALCQRVTSRLSAAGGSQDRLFDGEPNATGRFGLYTVSDASLNVSWQSALKASKTWTLDSNVHLMEGSVSSVNSYVALDGVAGPLGSGTSGTLVTPTTWRIGATVGGVVTRPWAYYKNLKLYSVPCSKAR